MRPYDSLFEQTADAMCELRRDGFVLRANRACRALLNPRACTFADSFDARHAAAIRGALSSLDEQMTTTSVDARVVDDDQVIRWQLTRVDDDLYVAAGRPLSAADAPTRDPMSAVGELAADIAHDFNNLLTGIIGAAELALHDAAEGRPVQEDLSQIRDAGERAAELSKRLLRKAREANVDLEERAPRQLDLLDAAREPAPKTIPRPPAASSPVLVVDDEDTVRRAITRMLEAAGHRVVSSGCPREALDLLEGMSSLSLLAADVTMPGMSGQELAAQARERFPEVPVLFITGYVSGPPESVASGCDRAQVLLKPFSMKSLSDAVEAAVHGATGAAEADTAAEPRQARSSFLPLSRDLGT